MSKYIDIVHNNTEEKQMRFIYKNKKVKHKFIGFFILFVCVAQISFAAQAPPTELKVLNSRAYREIYLNNTPMPLVRVHVEPAVVINDTTAYAVVETLPLGITPNSISHDGVWDENTRTIKWGLIFDDPQNHCEPILSYNVTGLDGSFVLSGKLSINGYEKDFLGEPLFDDTLTVTGYNESSILVDIIDNCTPAPTVLLEIVPAQDRESVVLSNFFNADFLVASSISPDGIYNDNDGSIIWNIAGNNIAVFSYTVQGVSGIFDIGISGIFSNSNPIEDVIVELNQSIKIFSALKRDILNNYTHRITVRIDVNPASDVTAYAVIENIPEGVSPFNISEDGVWNAHNRTVKWGVFLNDSAVKSLQYEISGDAGSYTLDGIGSFNGVSVDVSGENDVNIVYGEGVTRIVRGRILDESGDPVSGVTVQVQDEQGVIVNTVPDNPRQTNTAGRYRFNNVPAGTFFIVPVYGTSLFSPKTAVVEVSESSPERIRQNFICLGTLRIKQVTSSFFSDTDNQYNTSCMILIETKCNFLPYDIISGSINISSLSTGYVLNGQLTIDSSSVYYHWDTTDVPPADDYVVSVEVTNNFGDLAMDSSLAIELTNNLKGPFIFQNITDLSIPALPVPIFLQRSYNAASGFDGELGKGWVHNYSIHIIESSDGWVKVFNTNGTGSFFKPDENGGYLPSKGDKRRLTKFSNGLYKLADVKKGLEYHFNLYGRLMYTQQSHGARQNLSYENNLLKKVTDPKSGSFIEFTYNENKKLVQATDSRGRNVYYEYDINEKLVSVTYQSGNGSLITSYNYDNLGRLIQVLDSSNKNTFYSYDDENRVLSIENTGGLNRLDFQYNEVESSIVTSDAQGSETIITYNLTGQPVNIIDNNGNSTYITYNNRSYPISFQDANGNLQWFEYDNNGNILSLTNEIGNVSYFSYDPVSWQLTSVTDFKQKTTFFSYNGYDLTGISYPDGTSESFTYNSNAMLETKTDRNNNTIEYFYNSLGQLIKKLFPDNTSHIFTYDGATYNLIKIEDNDGYIELEYDDLDNIIQLSCADGNVVSYNYNAGNKLSRMIYPDATVVDYAYDNLNRLTSVSSFGQPLVAYTYNALGQVQSKYLGNGVNANYSYDPSGNMLELVNRFSNNAVVSSFVYTYDNIGNRLSMLSEIGRTDYIYDLNYELINIIYPSNSTQDILYDESGNRLSVTQDGVETQYISNDVNQYTQVGEDVYTFDNNGNMIARVTSEGITNYFYDYENRLIRVDNPNETILFSYDPLGRRVSKQTSAQTIKYVYDGDRVIMETDNNGVVLKKYFYGIQLDEIIAMVIGSQTYYYCYDASGSVTDIISADEILVESYTYKAFGLPDNEGLIGNSYLFTGREWEYEIGLYYFRARYYDPSLGRFISADPIQFGGGINFYSYCDNNPVNFIDPYGLSSTTNINATNTIHLKKTPSSVDVERFLHKNSVYEYKEAKKRSLWDKLIDFFRKDKKKNLLNVPCPGIRGDNNVGSTNSMQIAMNNGDPTFVQPSRRKKMDIDKKPVRNNGVTALILTPYDDSIIRANVPVFGLACGDNFKEYTVEFGKGIDPQTWTVIERSSIARSKQISDKMLFSLISGDATVHGNLATWDTGLKNYVYGDEYPADHPVDLNGVYTLRLIVTSVNGETVEDRVKVEVGRVIPNIYGGIARDADSNVILNIPEHALKDSFAVVSIKPVEVDNNFGGQNNFIGNVYEIRPFGEVFTKNADLDMRVTDSFSGSIEQLGIYSYNFVLDRWEYCPTVYAHNDRKLKTVLTSIPKEKAYFAIMRNTPALVCIISDAAKPYEINNVNLDCPVSDDIFLNYTFDNTASLRWSSRNGAEGALLSLKPRSARNNDTALCLTNQKYGGNFASTVINQLDAQQYRIIEFDYKIPPDVKINFMVKLDDRWYDVEFTDDPKEYPHLNIEKIGKIVDVRTDNKWHTAKFNLYEMLKGHAPIQDNDRFIVKEIIMADWDAAGFMKLVYGTNRAGASYCIDNFMIMKDKPSAWRKIAYKAKNIWNKFFTADSAMAKNSDSLLSLDSIQQILDEQYFQRKTGVFHNENFTGTISASLADDMDKGKVVELSYDVIADNEYAGFYRDLDNIDISGYRTLSFWIKGAEGKEQLRIGLKNRKGKESKLVLGAYLDKGISTIWRKVSIPLTAFAGVSDMSSMENLSFIFENKYNSSKGKIYVADFVLEKSLSPMVIANCSDCTGKTGWGNECWIFNTRNAHINFVDDKFGALIHFKGVVASKNMVTWSGWGMDLPDIDASDYDCLSFRIKKVNGHENPNIYLEDFHKKKYVDISNYCESSTHWQIVYIPLRDFIKKGLDIKSLKKLCFVFEWERMEGAVYVDDIRFTRFSKNSEAGEE